VSGPGLSLEEQVEAVIRLYGTPRAKAEAAVYGQSRAGAIQATPAVTPLAFPLILTVEWSLLVSDNNKYGPPQARRSKSGVTRAQNFLSKEYREAKRVLKDRFRTRLGAGRAATVPLHILYRFYWPDRRVHDASNHLKLLNDVLTGIVYRDDAQLHRGTWTTAVDPDRPRCEIEIRPL
jgi:Holliday junction resolvase RusA-like endonuclease